MSGSQNGARRGFDAISTGVSHNNQQLIQLVMYNIHMGWNSQLEMALHAMRHMNADLGVLTEMHLTGVHTSQGSRGLPGILSK